MEEEKTYTEGDSEFRAWDELPVALLGLILKNLSLRQVVRVIPLVCKSWGKYLEEPDCWQKINVDEWCYPYCEEYSDDGYNYLLRMLINKSSGFLRELSVTGVSDEQMLFIGEVAGPFLHTLSMSKAYISDSIAEEMATKLSGLTTLDLSDCREISPWGMESIGRNCQELVSLTWGSDFCDDPPHVDIALAIARTMPKLMHLRISEFGITTSVALEILSGCPELETLFISLTRGSDLHDPPHEDVARAIAHTMPKLKHLHITDFDINISVALEILSGCPELETLFISLTWRNDLHDPPHEDVAQATMPKLKHLDIPEFDINTSVALEILSCCPELETLYFAPNQCPELDRSLLKEKYPNVKVWVDDDHYCFDDDQCPLGEDVWF